MAKMRKLFLHIGKHKTGSTSIQKFLKLAEPVLAESQFQVVRDIEILSDGSLRQTPRYNCFQIAHVLLRPDLQTPVRLRGGVPHLSDPSIVAHQINAYLDEHIKTDAILSAEVLSFLRTPQEQELYQIIFRGFQLVPIGFFRQPIPWLHSWKLQLQKINLPNSLNNQGVFDLSRTSWLLQDSSIQAFFGTDGIYHSYETALLTHGTVLPVFLESLGINPNGFSEIASIWENSSKTPSNQFTGKQCR